MRWSKEESLPADVRADMRDLLAEALLEASRMADPGDGSMVILSAERILGDGMWDGGWKLQASFVEDERMHNAPFVVVHAYQGSQTTRGSVASDVVRTPADRRFLAEQRLASLVKRRDALNDEIDHIELELED